MALANIPAAYFACEGAESGDHCQLPGPTYGNCVLDTLCEDPEDTDVNECLLCVDGCWDSDPDEFCIQRDGTNGVCQEQDRCTSDPEKSFRQCNRCVDGDIHRTDPDSGCSAIDLSATAPWILVLWVAFLQVRRRQLS
jgi:uncharacterized protein (TIGR03382 family)